MKKRVLSVVLAFALLFSLCPLSAMAGTVTGNAFIASATLTIKGGVPTVTVNTGIQHTTGDLVFCILMPKSEFDNAGSDWTNFGVDNSTLMTNAWMTTKPIIVGQVDSVDRSATDVKITTWKAFKGAETGDSAGDELTPTALPKAEEEYEFMVWSGTGKESKILTASGIQTDANGDGMGDYAPPATPKHTVTYHKNDGTATTVGTQDVEENTTFTPNVSAPTRTGYAFQGWSTNQSATSADTTFTMGTANIDLYAVWTANNITLPKPANVTATYGTEANPAAFGVATNGTGNYTYSVEGSLPTGVTFNPATRSLSVAATAQATSAVTLTYKATDNDSSKSATQTFTLTINKRDLTADYSALSVTAKNYDRTTTATVTGTATATGVNGDSITVSLSGAANFNNKNVGTNKPVTATYALDTNSAKNYTLKNQPSLTGEIKAIPVTLATGTLAVTAKDFDNTTDATLTGAPTINGVISGDTVTATLTGGKGRFTADANAGTGKAVEATYTLSGTDAGNYTLANGTITGLTGEIRKINPTIDPAPTPVGGTSISMNTARPALTGGGAKGVGGATVNGTFAWKDADPVTITPANLAQTYTFTPSGADATNYKAVEGTITFSNAGAAATTAVLNNKTETYNGSPVTVDATVTVTAGGAAVPADKYNVMYEGTGTTTYAKSATAPKNAGTYKVTVEMTAAGAADYQNPTATATLTINKKQITAATDINMTGASVTKPYDGTVNAGQLNGTLSFNTGVIVGGDAVNISVASVGDYGDANVSADPQSVDLTISLTGAGKDNYEIDTTTLACADATITAIAPTLGDDVICTPVTEAGKTLADVTVSGTVTGVNGATVNGTFTWQLDPSTTVAEDQTYTAVFTPANGDAGHEHDGDNYTPVTVTFKPYPKKNDPTPGGIRPMPSFTVTYDAGEHGTIPMGTRTENVLINEKPKKVPTVTPDEGWRFLGWSRDNRTTIDPTTVRVDRNLTFKALYAEGPELNKVDHILYIKGYPDGTFGPENGITRAEAATIYARLMTKPIDESATYACTFNDVSADAWYANYIGYMQQFGVIGGYPDGSFKPDEKITRAEFATMAARFEVLNTTGSNVFSDVSSGHWAYESILSDYNNGWITGYPDGTFKPENNITRAEVVKIVNRMLERTITADSVAGATYNTFSDIAPDHWAYWDVVEASNTHDYDKSTGVEIWK